jgi:pimeloyl-ACP methyl ester carboxylesterase
LKPHFFGSGDSPLYGVYDEPRVTVEAPRAVVACYPIAGEYMRAHRAFRQLSNFLTRAGAHVLRFDYTGTGDSFGEPDARGIAGYVEDIRAACGELRELSSARTVTLVGLRFGATLAALAADVEEAVSHVALWDPIVEGEGYVKSLEATHIADKTGRRESTATSGTIGVNGFPVSPGLRREISGLDLRRWAPKRSFKVDLVVSSEQPAWSEFGEAIQNFPGGGRYTLSPSAGGWGEADAFGSALIPQQIIQSVVDRVMEKGA